MTIDLLEQGCTRQAALLSAAQIAHYQSALHADWRLAAEGNSIFRRFGFPDFVRSMAFANAVAWIAEQQDHHPELRLGWGYCEVCYSTHSVGGLSLNDFICAARIDALNGATQHHP